MLFKNSNVLLTPTELERRKTMSCKIRKARWHEIFVLHELINNESSINGTVLKKSYRKLLGLIGNYHVAVLDGHIIGCAGYKVWPGRFCEIISVVLRSEARGGGVGSALVEATITDILKKGFRNIFCLTGAVGFFENLGFRPDEKTRYPQKIWSDCKGCSKNTGDPLNPVCLETAMTYKREI
jgi:amino-acid N-acetyltransferase